MLAVPWSHRMVSDWFYVGSIEIQCLAHFRPGIAPIFSRPCHVAERKGGCYGSGHEQERLSWSPFWATSTNGSLVSRRDGDRDGKAEVLWRAVDSEGEVLDFLIQAERQND